MRRVRATVHVNGKGQVVEAWPKAEGKDPKPVDGRLVDGYIEVPLNKGRSRSKGNGLEILVAKAFSTWLYGRDDILKRTPLSGGWGSGKLGDITMDPALAMELKIPKPPRIYVECKNREGILDESFWRYLATGTPGTIGEWALDTFEKARKLDQMPFLILKGRATEPFVFSLVTPEFPWASKPLGCSTCLLPIFRKDGGSNVHPASFFPLSRLGLAYGNDTVQELKG